MPSAAAIVCLLDDEPSVLRALGRLLSSEGLNVEKFSEPTGFLEHARTHRVRLAILDIRMPGLTGLEVLAQLRVISPETRVIIVSAENDPVQRSAALMGGASAFFLKPFDTGAFLAAVREALAPST